MENQENTNNDHVWDDTIAPPAPSEPTHEPETPIVEAPVVEAIQPEATPVAEAITPVSEASQVEILNEEHAPVVTEKVIEKIIEKYPEFENEDAKSLYDAFLKGDEDNIYEYLAQKRKDYQSMSDYDVVREGLKRDNPSWTDKRLELEFKTKYDIATKKDLTELDPDTEEYEKGVAYNDGIDQKETLLAMQAEDYRIKLNEQKKNIQLPKIEDKAQAVSQPSEAEIAEANRAWEALVATEVPKVEGIRLNVNGEEVLYKATDADKAELSTIMKNFNAVDYLTKERGWFDENGNANVKNITEDVYRFMNMDKIASSVATRSANATKKAVVSEIKNVDLSRNGSVPEVGKVDAGEAVWGY